MLLGIRGLLNDERCDFNCVNEKLTELLIKGAEITLGFKKQNIGHKTKDKRCAVAKRKYNNAIAKLRFVKSDVNYHLKRQACKEYKLAVRNSLHEANKRFNSKLRRLKSSNSAQYWSLLNNKGSDKIDISCEELKEHFMQLASSNDETTDDILKNVLIDDAPNFLNRNILDNDITENEVIIACRKLKNNKSAG